MKRADCLTALYAELQDKLVVTIMGACAQELYDLGHLPNFFYLEHAMGLASSIGLGLAMNTPSRKVVVLDGDGSVLMNLGTLATLARYRPRNMVHIIFDNGSLLSTGGFPSHTAGEITDLAAIARGAGCPHVASVSTMYDFLDAAGDAFEGDDRLLEGRTTPTLLGDPVANQELAASMMLWVISDVVRAWGRTDGGLTNPSLLPVVPAAWDDVVDQFSGTCMIEWSAWLFDEQGTTFPGTSGDPSSRATHVYSISFSGDANVSGGIAAASSAAPKSTPNGCSAAGACW